MEKLIEKLKNCEFIYKKHFCETNYHDKMIQFKDSKLSDMYAHNYFYISDIIDEHFLSEMINQKISDNKIINEPFLQIEFDGVFNNYSKLLIKPMLSVLDYMYFDLTEEINFKFNQDTVCKKADTEIIMNDAVKIGILANESSMGHDFAKRRIMRKKEVYLDDKNKLDLYVVYYKGEVVGKCEFLRHNDIVKIEDFDVYEPYQRKGIGSALVYHLLCKAKEEKCKYAYLITEQDDTAKDMYKKLGFKKISEKTELFFKLK